MSWLPTFLNPWVAAAAAAAASSLLLVLYFLKLRRREMPVSSTLLWRKAIQDLQVNAPFQRLRRNLLLLLQLLLLAFLCLALARPVANISPGATHLTVILVDRSGSMSAVEDYGNGVQRTRLDEAKRKAKELVESMTRKDSAVVIAFDDSADVVQSFTSDQASLKNAIDSIQPTDRKSRLKLAYKLAEAQTAYFPEQLRPNEKPGIFVFSDGRIADVKELSVRGDVKFTRIGRDDTPNAAIVALSAARNYERPNEVQVFARLANYGPAPVSTDVRVLVDGKLASTATDLLLVPDRWSDKGYAGPRDDKLQPRDTVTVPKLELTTAAVIKVEQVKSDALASDDAAYVVVPPPKALAVLLVTDGNYFLEKALDAMGLQHPVTLNPQAYEQKKPQEYDVVIFDRYTPKFMPNGGNFIWFGCIPPNARVKDVKEGTPPQTAVVTDTMVLDWKRDHPILRGLQLAKLYVGEALKVQVPIETETLVEGFKGPLVLLHREGRSTHLICAFDLLQSNWPLRLSFPIFMHNALQYLALGTDMDVRESFAPGATPIVPRTNLQKYAAEHGGKPLTEFKLLGPDTLPAAQRTRTVKVPEAGDVALPALDRVGLYTTDPPIPQFEKIAVNLLDSAESNILPAQDLPGGVVIGTGGTGKSRLELWWWIVACLALPLLLIEWWVYTRRVHL